MMFIQVCAFAVCGLLFSIILKSMNSPISRYIIAAIILVVAGMIVVKLGDIIVQLKKLLDFANINQTYIGLLFKVVGITYITHFTADLFKDNGHSAAADLMEVFCRISIAAISIPIVLSLFETVAKCI